MSSVPEARIYEAGIVIADFAMSGIERHHFSAVARWNPNVFTRSCQCELPWFEMDNAAGIKSLVVKVLSRILRTSFPKGESSASVVSDQDRRFSGQIQMEHHSLVAENRLAVSISD